MSAILPARVLIVTPLYPPHSLGGTQLRARKMARWLNEHGISVQVVCVEHIQRGTTDTLDTVRDDAYEGIPVHRLYLTHTNTLKAFRYTYDHPEIVDYIESLIQSWKPDLIHLISGYLVTANALAAAPSRQIPTVVTLTDYWFVCPRINLIRSNGQPCGGPYDALDCTRCVLSESRRYRLPENFFPGIADAVWHMLSKWGKDTIPLYREIVNRERLLISLLNQADAIILPTNSLRSKFLGVASQKRFHLVRHGLVLEDLGLTHIREKSKSQLFRFGYMGQISYVKGVDLLLEAYRQLLDDHQDISLTIWGDVNGTTPYLSQLRAACDNLPRVQLRGRYSSDQVGEILQDIDVLVMSARWPEIGPFVILEAFAAQTPVIAAAIGNIPELVMHGTNGLLFEPGSIGDLATQMRQLLDDPTRCSQLCMGIGAVRTQDDEMGEQLEVYSQVLGKCVTDETSA